MIQIRWNSLNYYTINSRFGAANFHEIIDQIFSSIINNVINSIPWTDSSMCFIVDKKKEKKKKKNHQRSRPTYQPSLREQRDGVF